MQVEWLVTFIAVIDKGGFSAAAAARARSQSSVSTHIALLERVVGASLFDRNQRPVQLTDAGRLFESHARAMLDQWDMGRYAVAALHGVVQGKVTLGAYASAGSTFVPSVVTNLMNRHRQVGVKIYESWVAGLDQALISGKADALIRPHYPELDPEEFEICPLWREDMVLLVHTAHRLADEGGPIPMQHLGNERLIIGGKHLRQATEASLLLGTAGVETSIAHVTDQPQTLVGMVRAGMGIGFANRLVLEGADRNDIAVLRTDPPQSRTVNAVRRVRSRPSPAAAALWDELMLTPVPADTVDLRTDVA